MKQIGIVAGDHPDIAARIKAAILFRDPAVKIVVDEEDLRGHEARGRFLVMGDKMMGQYGAVSRLADAGCQLVAFSCGCPHHFFRELQAEFTVRLVDSCTEDGRRLPPSEYAEKILAADPAPLPKPFKLGMIGGLGPAATVDLFDKIVRATPAKTDQEHFRMMIDENPQVPDRTAGLLYGGADPTLALFGCAKRLEAAGCDCIIIPCNTAHAFLPRLTRRISIPFIDMQESAINEIIEKKGRDVKIGLLATSGTVATGIYAGKAGEAGLVLEVPDDGNQAKVMDSIYGPKGAKAGFTDGPCRDELLEAAAYLVREKGCGVLILGCTELPLILEEGELEVAGTAVTVIDPTAALARRVAALAQKAFEERGVR